jgi:ATP-dependent Clp protease ATP-binding subunit ClpC
MKEIIYELKDHPEIILFIDEVHNLVGAGSAEGALDAASILKPALSRGEIQIIGATTPDEYRKYIESDRALERRFQKVYVKDPSPEEVKSILMGLRDRYEKFHGIKYTEEAIDYAVKLADRYIGERSFPDKALDIMDEAGARAKIAGKEFVGKKEVEEVISLWTGIPLPQLDEGEEKKIANLEKNLRKYVLSQDAAIAKVVSAIKRARAGMKPQSRPWGVFLFLGPTGVGKTHLAKMLARFLMGSENKLIRFDMSEYKEEHTISRLVGSPPGYVGYKEGGQLTEKVKNNPYSVILFDEIEKAHPAIYQLLLQVFDDGRLTDAMGRTVDFRHAIIVMTSNLGSRSFLEERKIGFAGEEKKEKEDRIMDEVKKHFPPEFINRIDEIVIFNPLDEKTLMNILLLYQEEINQQAREHGWQLRLFPSALRLILKATEKERNFGARPLRRALETMVLDPLSTYLFKRKRKGIVIEVKARKGKIYFKSKTEKEMALTRR